MENSNTFVLYISFKDLELDDEEKEAEAQKLLAEMKELDEVDDVGCVPHLNLPPSHKALELF